MKLVFGMAAVALLLVSSTLEGTALRHFDWPNSGTCMGGPRDGKMVRDLKFCNFFLVPERRHDAPESAGTDLADCH